MNNLGPESQRNRLEWENPKGKEIVADLHVGRIEKAGMGQSFREGNAASHFDGVVSCDRSGNGFFDSF